MEVIVTGLVPAILMDGEPSPYISEMPGTRPGITTFLNGRDRFYFFAGAVLLPSGLAASGFFSASVL